MRTRFMRTRGDPIIKWKCRNWRSGGAPITFDILAGPGTNNTEIVDFVDFVKINDLPDLLNFSDFVIFWDFCTIM